MLVSGNERKNKISIRTIIANSVLNYALCTIINNLIAIIAFGCLTYKLYGTQLDPCKG